MICCLCTKLQPTSRVYTKTCASLFQHVIRGNRPIKAEMAHQLYVLQVLTFNLLEERMMTKMDPNDQVKVEMMNLTFRSILLSSPVKLECYKTNVV